MYQKPEIISHQTIQFETQKSGNPPFVNGGGNNGHGEDHGHDDGKGHNGH